MMEPARQAPCATAKALAARGREASAKQGRRPAHNLKLIN